jgi:type IV pilus assembly protein PilW
LIVSNRFAIVSTSIVQPSGSTVTTGSISCNGNGQASESNTYQPIFEGIEDMVIRYGVHDGSGNLSPQRFYTATEVSALAAAGGLTGWQRVASVRVCLLARTLQNTRLPPTGEEEPKYHNCRGDPIPYDASDRSIYKTFERTFAVRNNITGSY